MMWRVAADSFPVRLRCRDMSRLRTPLLALLVTAVTGVLAAPAGAIVGGAPTSDARHKGVAEITFGPGFGCTGTLIAPRWVLSAGHCGSVTGGVGVGTPVAWPAATIDVRLGSFRSGEGTRYPVAEAIVSPDYLLTDAHDIALLRLAGPVPTSAGVPSTAIAHPSERAIWAPGAAQAIVGWGALNGGDDLGTTPQEFPDTLQAASVPVISDAACDGAVGTFDPETMVCAGELEKGGVDTCQGDSGGPMFGTLPDGVTLRVTGSTSFGEGCAEPGKPGVYARVADTTLRNWIASVTGGEGLAPAPVVSTSQKTATTGAAPTATDTKSTSAPAAKRKPAAKKRRPATCPKSKKRSTSKSKRAKKKRCAPRRRS